MKVLQNIVKNFKNMNLFSSEITKLGRWEHRINDNQKRIKFIYNNSDHCGDVICGNPKIVKKLTNNETK